MSLYAAFKIVKNVYFYPIENRFKLMNELMYLNIFKCILYTLIFQEYNLPNI